MKTIVVLTSKDVACRKGESHHGGGKRRISAYPHLVHLPVLSIVRLMVYTRSIIRLLLSNYQFNQDPSILLNVDVTHGAHASVFLRGQFWHNDLLQF